MLACYFVFRPFYDSYAPTAEEIYAVNVVDLPGVSVIEVVRICFGSYFGFFTLSNCSKAHFCLQLNLPLSVCRE
jgi:hypothetical protein